MIRAAVVLASLALVIFVATWQSQPPPKEDSKASNQPADPQVQQRPFAVEIQQTPKQAADDQKQRAEEASANRAVVKLTGWLVLVGIGTGIVVGWQAWETRKAAQAAVKQAAAAHRALVFTQRAYISVGDWEFQGGAVPYRLIAFNVQNTGRSHAVLEFMDASETDRYHYFNSALGQVAPDAKQRQLIFLKQAAKGRGRRTDSRTVLPSLP